MKGPVIEIPLFGKLVRGIDVQQVSTVLNFDVPGDVHTYLHRIGRSGRWGRKGLAINFMTRRDVAMMRRIEEYYRSSIKELPQDVGALCNNGINI